MWITSNVRAWNKASLSTSICAMQVYAVCRRVTLHLHCSAMRCAFWAVLPSWRKSWSSQWCCLRTCNNTINSLLKLSAISWLFTGCSLFLESTSNLNRQRVCTTRGGCRESIWVTGPGLEAPYTEPLCSKYEEMLVWHWLIVENTFLHPHHNYYWMQPAPCYFTYSCTDL